MTILVPGSDSTATRRSPIKRSYLAIAVAVILLLGGLVYLQVTPSTQKASDCSLTETERISLPNIPGRLDHMAFSADLRLLIVAARNNNSLAVANTTTMKLDKVAGGFSLPNAVAFVNQDKALVVTNGGNGTVLIIDPLTFGTLAKVDLQSNADNMVVNLAAARLYVGYGSGGVAFISMANWKVIQSAPLVGHPEAIRLEENGSKLFVNVPAGNYVAVLDKNSGQTLGSLLITNATGVFPMALDEAHHILFVGSRAPAKLIMIDTLTGAEVAELNVPGDADDIFYDAGNGCVFVSSGSGYVTAVKEITPSSFMVAQTIQTYPGARTSLLDARSGLYFLAVPQSQNASAMVIVYSVGR
jgi:DNA-binding beta-propeller fold protein YncE